MKRDIEISGIVCHFKSSAAIPRIYRLKFHRDIFVDMEKIRKSMDVQQRLQKEKAEAAKENGEEIDTQDVESTLPVESLELFENIAYLMHKHGDPSQPDSIEDWLDQFDMFDIYTILPEILMMWNMETEQMSQAKKKIARSTVK